MARRAIQKQGFDAMRFLTCRPRLPIIRAPCREGCSKSRGLAKGPRRARSSNSDSAWRDLRDRLNSRRRRAGAIAGAVRSRAGPGRRAGCGWQAVLKRCQRCLGGCGWRASAESRARVRRQRGAGEPVPEEYETFLAPTRTATSRRWSRTNCCSGCRWFRGTKRASAARRAGRRRQRAGAAAAEETRRPFAGLRALLERGKN